MIEHLINYAASLFNALGGGWNVARLVQLLLVGFALIAIAGFQVVIYEREKESKNHKKILLQARLERLFLVGASLERLL